MFDLVDPDKTEEEAKLIARIDGMDYEALVRLRRFAPSGEPIFQAGAAYDHFVVRLHKLEKLLSDGERVAISKRVGWD